MQSEWSNFNAEIRRTKLGRATLLLYSRKPFGGYDETFQHFKVKFKRADNSGLGIDCLRQIFEIVSQKCEQTFTIVVGQKRGKMLAQSSALKTFFLYKRNSALKVFLNAFFFLNAVLKSLKKKEIRNSKNSQR